MDKYYIQKDEIGNAVLLHFGVAGMKWGVRKDRVERYKQRQYKYIDKVYDKRQAKLIKKINKDKKRVRPDLVKADKEELKQLKANRKKLKRYVKSMTVKDIRKEQLAAGAYVLGVLSADVGSVAVASAIGAPLTIVHIPNPRGYKLNRRSLQVAKNTLESERKGS